MPPVQEYYANPLNNMFEVNEYGKRVRLHGNMMVEGATVTDQLIVQNTEDDATASITGTVYPQLTDTNPSDAGLAQILVKSNTCQGRYPPPTLATRRC